MVFEGQEKLEQKEEGKKEKKENGMQNMLKRVAVC